VTEGNAAISTGKPDNWLTKLIGESDDWHIVFKLVNCEPLYFAIYSHKKEGFSQPFVVLILSYRKI
jgi:hypothetical protein